MLLTWVEIDFVAIKKNIAALKEKISKKTKFMAVVKGNAYGHGFFEVAKNIASKVDYLAVYDFDDAIFLRKKKIKTTIFVLGKTPAKKLAYAAKNDIEISVSSFETLISAAKIKSEKKLIIHLCVETGFGRDGFVFEDFAKILSLIKNKNIEVKGLYSHLTAAGDASLDEYSKTQFKLLLKWQEAFNKCGFFPQLHLSSSGSIIAQTIDHEFAIARFGVALFGLWSAKELQSKIELLPVLSWKTRIVEIKHLPCGHHVSYGPIFTLKRDSKIAILPIGYFDGIPRISSNRGYFLVNGKRAPQIGRVTMNVTAIDITDIDAKEGDEVTIIGRDGDEVITAKDWGDWSDTISYEITTRINCQIKRLHKY